MQIVDEDVSVDDVVEKIESFEDEVSDARAEPCACTDPPPSDSHQLAVVRVFLFALGSKRGYQ